MVVYVHCYAKHTGQYSTTQGFLNNTVVVDCELCNVIITLLTAVNYILIIINSSNSNHGDDNRERSKPIVSLMFNLKKTQ